MRMPYFQRSFINSKPTVRPMSLGVIFFYNHILAPCFVGLKQNHPDKNQGGGANKLSN